MRDYQRLFVLGMRSLPVNYIEQFVFAPFSIYILPAKVVFPCFFEVTHSRSNLVVLGCTPTWHLLSIFSRTFSQIFVIFQLSTSTLHLLQSLYISIVTHLWAVISSKITLEAAVHVVVIVAQCNRGCNLIDDKRSVYMHTRNSTERGLTPRCHPSMKLNHTQEWLRNIIGVLLILILLITRFNVPVRTQSRCRQIFFFFFRK